MGRVDRLAFACAVLAVVGVLMASVLAILVVVSPAALSGQAQTVDFAVRPKDRPVLETVSQVWQAQTTGVSEFCFDGVHYVVDNLPNEYVKYSSWYCRMP